MQNQDLLKLLESAFIQRALIGGIISAFLCAVIGVFLTLRKESLVPDAIAHASLSGVAIALILGHEPLIYALVIGVVMSVGITFLKKNSKISSDAIIGILSTELLAIGVIIIYLSKVYIAEVDNYLFGSILFISWTDILYAFIILIISTFFISFLYPKLVYMTFDPEGAFIRGIKVTQLDYIIGILSSLTIIISVKIVGIILVAALIIIPATCAKLIAKNFSQMFPISIVLSIISTLLGVIISSLTSTPPGAIIVLTSGVIFLLTLLLSKLLKK